MNLLRFIGRRTAFYLFTAWAAITLNFFLPRLMPGDAVASFMMRHPALPPEAIQSIRILFGMDHDYTLWQQYIQYWQLLLNGDLGRSVTHGLVPVTYVIAGGLPWTIGLVGIATLLTFAIGTLIGGLIGWFRGTKADIIIPISTFVSTVPFFWLALIMVAIFSVVLGWFPTSHAFTVGSVPNWSWDFVGQVIRHGALPAATIIIASLGGWILGMRNMTTTVLDEDYITVAQAKGTRTWRVVTKYAGRNAILPQIQSFALSLGFIVGGSLILEMVFSYPGIGLLLVRAVQQRDFPLLQGIFLILTLSVLIANVLADVLYGILDPRTRQSEA